MKKIILTTLLSSVVIPLSVFAQQQSTSELEVDNPKTSTSTQAQTSQNVERLQVTGSYIRRIDTEGPSPLEIMDRSEFDLLGSTTLDEALKENVAFEAVFEGPGHVRFRGQHAGNVLILLNGMRLPKQGGGYYTSINGLPTSVLERVEMLKDGGSALYGSDAMSGVMNFITRDSFHGAEVQASTTISESGAGAQRSYVGSFGQNFARANVLGVLQVEQADSYTELDVGSFNNDPNVSQEVTSNIELGSRNANTLKYGPICSNGEVCQTDPLMFQEARPDNQNISSLVSARYEFPNMDINLLGMFNRRESTSRGRTSRLAWQDDRHIGGPNNALNVNSMDPSPMRQRIMDENLADADGYVELVGTFTDEFGDRINERTEDSLNLQSQLRGYIGYNWSWQAEAGFSQLDSENQITSGEIDQNLFRELIERGMVDIGPDGVDSNFLEAARITPTYRNKGQMFTQKLVFSGELFSLHNLYDNGGSVNLAAGIENQSENFSFNNDRELTDGTTLSSPTTNFSGSRNVQSAFMEISAYPLNNLEVQLAHRFDHYSDVGNTYNPKMALAYKPIEQIMLRGSIGTGFRAPGITDLYAGSQDSISRFRDQANCDGGCSQEFYDTTVYTDEDIKPEDSLHYSLGGVFQATRNISLSVDQWNFEGKNTLSAIRPEEFTFIENEQGPGALESIGVETVRDEDGNLLSMRHPRVMNMGERTLRGVDIGLNATFDVNFLAPMRLGLSASNSYIFTRETRKFDFGPVEKGDASWKNRISTSLSNDHHHIRVSALTVSSDEVGFGDFTEKLPQYTEYDFTYAYTANWGGKFNFVVKNLANSRPPVQEGGNSVYYASTSRNFSSFSPLRRRLFMSYSQTF